MMIRPVSGDFVLDGAAIALMREEIRLGAWCGVAGVVLGATRPEGGLDYDALARFREAARDVQLVLHRAIDLVADPVEAVRRVAALGYDKVLSSGGALRAVDGATTLAGMVEAAGNGLSIIAGSGGDRGQCRLAARSYRGQGSPCVGEFSGAGAAPRCHRFGFCARTAEQDRRRSRACAARSDRAVEKCHANGRTS